VHFNSIHQTQDDDKQWAEKQQFDMLLPSSTVSRDASTASGEGDDAEFKKGVLVDVWIQDKHKWAPSVLIELLNTDKKSLAIKFFCKKVDGYIAPGTENDRDPPRYAKVRILEDSSELIVALGDIRLEAHLTPLSVIVPTRTTHVFDSEKLAKASTCADGSFTDRNKHKKKKLKYASGIIATRGDNKEEEYFAHATVYRVRDLQLPGGVCALLILCMRLPLGPRLSYGNVPPISACRNTQVEKGMSR
jgi:hypothetical protein